MLPIARPIFNLSILFLISVLPGCASETPVTQSQNKKIGLIKIIRQPYETVWRGAQLALKYPISVNNIDNGVLETEWVKGIDGFNPPGIKKEPSTGVRYKITINMVKGNFGGRPSTKITIMKKLERQRDFFADVEPISSDGLEEKTLMYRIEREIVIDEAIKKSAQEQAAKEMPTPDPMPEENNE